MPSAFIQYMRAHGNTPSRTQRPAEAGAVAGAIASVPAVSLLWFAGGLESLARSLSVPQWLALALQILTMTLAGALYGRVFNRAANDQRGGWLFGISYGFLIWMLGPASLLQWITSRPVAVGEAAMALFGGHLVYGLSLGSFFPWVHNRLQDWPGDGRTESRGRRN